MPCDFLLRIGHLNIIIWWLWKSDSPTSPEFSGIFVFLFIVFVYYSRLSMCGGFTWGIKLKFSWVFFEHLSLGMNSHFLISSDMKLLLNFIDFNVWLTEVAKEKNKEQEKGINPLIHPEVFSDWGRETCNNEGSRCNNNSHLSLCLYLWD